MNKITAIGRLTKEIELKKTAVGTTYCRFNLACKSKQKGENGENQMDFFLCVAWRNTAELMQKYCKKGNLLLVSGFMNSRTYKAKNGEKTTIWELNVEDLEFVSQKTDDPSLTEIEDEECPF